MDNTDQRAHPDHPCIEFVWGILEKNNLRLFYGYGIFPFLALGRKRDDPERSWANFHYYDYQDASQTWRFENLDIRSFPTILVQPPRSGKYGDPTTVVFQSPYKGKPTELANDITSAIKQYVIKLQQTTPVRETQHGHPPV